MFFKLKSFTRVTMVATRLKGFITKIRTYFTGSVIFFNFYHGFSEIFGSLAMCAGSSMEPTINDKELVVISKIGKYKVQRGDIVIIRSPYDPMRYLCKRVIHLPGESVEEKAFRGVLPGGKIWLEGDNYLDSYDSREFGPVPEGLIVGKAIYIIWPRLIDLRDYLPMLKQ